MHLYHKHYRNQHGLCQIQCSGRHGDFSRIQNPKPLINAVSSFNRTNSRAHPTASQCPSYGHHAEGNLCRPQAAACFQTLSSCRHRREARKRVACTSCCSEASTNNRLHGVFDLLHLFRSIHIAVTAFLRVHSPLVFNNNFKRS